MYLHANGAAATSTGGWVGVCALHCDCSRLYVVVMSIICIYLCMYASIIANKISVLWHGCIHCTYEYVHIYIHMCVWMYYICMCTIFAEMSFANSNFTSAACVVARS